MNNKSQIQSDHTQLELGEGLPASSKLAQAAYAPAVENQLLLPEHEHNRPFLLPSCCGAQAVLQGLMVRHACWLVVDSWQASWSWLISHCFYRPLRYFIPEAWKTKTREANTGKETAKRLGDREACAGIIEGTAWIEKGMKNVNHMIEPLSYNSHTVTTFAKLLPYMVTHYFAAAAVAIEI